MNVNISKIIFKEIIPDSFRRTGYNMLFYYLHKWREKRRLEREQQN
jgi:hypothetical protein